MFLAFLLAFIAPGGTILAHRRIVYWAGVALIVGASLLRRHCMRMLGRSFTGAVVVLPGQEVVERGAYRFVRHPSYTAGFVLFTGVGLVLTNWMSVTLLIAAPILVYNYRAGVEERALVATLGDPYLDYMRRTKRFIPFVV
jgi:protein-S-isoprenylcysteine O-methyltransferase Ste14